jgi:hypothetical protein
VCATCGLSDGLATSLCGLATCFGASTVTPGSWVCEIAVPLRAHNNAVDRIATAEGATGLDDILTTLLRGGQIPFHQARHRYLRRLSSATLNLLPAIRLVQYHQALFRSQPVNTLVLMHPV